MVTELDGVGRLGLDALRKAMEEQAATRASWVTTAMKRGASWVMGKLCCPVDVHVGEQKRSI